jgi:hypothetical protein
MSDRPTEAVLEAFDHGNTFYSRLQDAMRIDLGVEPEDDDPETEMSPVPPSWRQASPVRRPRPHDTHAKKSAPPYRLPR